LGLPYPFRQVGQRWGRAFVPSWDSCSGQVIKVNLSTNGLSGMARFAAAVAGNLDRHTAAAMTFAGFDAQSALKAETPRYVNSPTKWTQNATFVKRATPTSLAVTIGFKEWASKGTPSAKYLQPMVAGEPRRQKSTERQLSSAGIIRPGEFIVPTGVYPLELNDYGNLPGSTYTQVLSRLRALGGAGQGYTGSATDSTRSRRRREQADYFMAAPGNLPRGIQARVGPLPKGTGGKGSPLGGRPVTSNLRRGFHTVFYITNQPRYRATFPVLRIIESTFNSRFPSIFERLVFKSR